MYRLVSRASAVAPVAALAFTLACGGRSPVAPTETVATALPTPSTMSATGSAATPTATVAPQAIAVAGAHLNGVIETIDADARTLIVRDKTVSVPEGATIEDTHGAAVAFADLAVGNRVSVVGTENGSTIVADAVKVHSAQSGHADVKGAASDLSGACPDKSFKIGSTAVTVDVATEYAHGACDDIAAEVVVEVRGTRQDGGAILATLVKFEREAHAPHHVEANGAVSDLAGDCPGRTFKIGSTAIVVAETTEFARGVCGDLANEKQVEVRGTAIEGGIAATLVRFENPHNPSPGPSKPDQGPNPAPPSPGKPAKDVQFEGTVSDVDGGCPGVSFKVGSRSVVTNGSTKYAAGRCGDIANGRKVEVSGSEADGVVTAWQVRFRKK